MAKEKLLQALKRQACTEILELRHEAEERKRQLRKECARRLRLERRTLRTSELHATHLKLHREHNQSMQDLRVQMTEHRWQLAETYRPLAEEVFKGIWEEERSRILHYLFKELPPVDWTSIHVAKDDLDLAQRYAGSLTVSVDPELEGGLIVDCEHRGLQVDCSLSTVLKRLWPVLLPKLLKRISDEVTSPSS